MANIHTSRVVVPLRPGSDGDTMHKPVGPAYSKVDPPTLYLEKIGDQWMKARGEARTGVQYSLERLPAGYTLYQRPRAKNPSIVDKYLFGHPERKPFDSPNRFFPHFLHLMENDGSNIGCPCTMCNTKGGILPRSESRSSSHSRLSDAARIASQAKGRPKRVLSGMENTHVDEEGNPDIYRNFIDQLKRHGTLDEAIMEPMSMDWRAEQAILPDLLTKLNQEPQWIPRAGDIVLYVQDIPDGVEIAHNPRTKRFEYFKTKSRTYMGVPSWRAGLVGQSLDDTIFSDAAQAKEFSVSLSGIRVEPLPDPNRSDKSLSKRHKYIPVNHTRPFFLWGDYLNNIFEDDWHPTIKNALTVMSTMSLMGKHRFRGQWPDAMIYSHGIFIGAEMLVVGDTVRLLPKSSEVTCTDILVIKTIRLKLSNLDKASVNDYDEGRPYNSEVWIFGAAYTSNATRSSKEWLSPENVDVPKSSEDYGDWYPLHPSTQELAVPLSRILGRLCEHDAMEAWLSYRPNIDQGRKGLVDAQAFARANDKRITSSFGATWFWADSRSEALDLHTVNGLEVGKYDAERDPNSWRKKIKVMEGVSSGKKLENLTMQTQAPAAGRNLRAFMAPANATLPVRSQGPASSRRVGASRSTSTGESSTFGRKRQHAVDFNGDEDDDDDDDDDVDVDEEDEEEIRQHTRFINDRPKASQKKPKVQIVVD